MNSILGCGLTILIKFRVAHSETSWENIFSNKGNSLEIKTEQISMKEDKKKSVHSTFRGYK